MAEELKDKVFEFASQCQTTSEALGAVGRFDKSFQGVERDWSQLPTFLDSCENEFGNETTICLNVTKFLGTNETDELIEMMVNGAENPWVGVFQSYPLYAGLAGALGVLCFVFLFLYIFVKCISCCCRVCCKRGNGDKGPETPRRAMFCQFTAIFILFFFIIFCLAYIGVGNEKGNKGFTDALIVVATTPAKGTAQLIASLPSVLENSFNLIVGTTLVKSLEIFNATLTDNINIVKIRESLDCTDSALSSVSTATIDEFRLMIDQVENASAAFPDINVIITQLDDVDSKTTSLSTTLQDILTFITDLGTTIDNIDLSTIETSISTLNNTINVDLKPAISDLKTDLQTMDTNIPTSSDTTDTVTALDAFSSSPSHATADTVITQIDVLINKLSNIPAGVDTKIENVKTLFAQATTDLDGLVTVFTNSKTTLEAIPNSTEVTNTMAPLRTLLQGLDLSSMKTSLTQIGDVIDMLPSDFAGKKTTITNIQDSIDMACILQISTEFDNLNRSLIQLPDEFANITSMLDDLNVTISPALGQLDTLKTLLDDVDGAMAKIPNITEYVGLIDDMQAKVDSGVATLDSVDDSTALVQEKMGLVNLDDLIANISSVSTTLGSSNPVNIDSATIAEIANLNTTRHQAIDSLTTTKDAIVLWKTSYGDSGFAGTCKSNSQPCDPGSYGNCADQNDCTFTDIQNAIEASKTEITSLETSLSNQPDFNAIITGLDDGLSSMDFELIGSSTLDTLQTSLNDFDISSYSSQIGSIKTNVDSTRTTLDISAMKGDITDAESLISSAAADVTSYKSTLDSLNDMVNGMDIQDMLTSMLELIVALENLLYRDLAVELNNIRGDIVKTKIQSEGFLEGMLLVAGTIDDIIEPLMDAMAKVSNSTNSSMTSITELVQNSSSIIEAIELAADRDEENSIKARGALFYVLSVITKFTENSNSNSSSGFDGVITNPDEFESYRVTQDTKLGVQGAFLGPDSAEVTEYFNGSICVTDECLTNTITIYNTVPVEGAPLSRQNAFTLLYVFPGLVVFLALVAMLCQCTGKVCVAPFVLCGCLTAPFLFIIVGATMFPMLLLTSDVCANMEGVVLAGVEPLEQYICETTLGWNYTIENGHGMCVMDLDDSNDLRIDIDETLTSILHTCEGSSWANVDKDLPGAAPQEPIAQLWSHLKSISKPFLAKNIRPLILDQNGTKPGQALEDGVDDMIDELAITFEQVVDELGTAFSCDGLAYVFETVKEPICCNLVDALFYMSVPFYMIALSIFFVMVPVLCCVRKRETPSKVWATVRQK